jgi:hypothetical protein
MTRDTPKIATGDAALILAAQTGEGLVTITPDLAEQISDSIRTRTADIEARYPALVEACDYETRLAVTAQVFAAIVDHAKPPGGSFRYLIYDRLGFQPDAYLPLYEAGGMVISNEFDLTDAPTPDPTRTALIGSGALAVVRKLVELVDKGALAVPTALEKDARAVVKAAERHAEGMG